MRQTFQRAFLDTQEEIAVITLNHDATINALSTAMVESLNAALDGVDKGGFRALVVTGAGRGFCSGADMKELPARREEGAGQVLERLFHPLFRRLRDLPMPVVMAVNGPAVGIGMSLALMGDLIVASRTASFLLSFTRIGLVPDGGLSFLLPRMIGLARAREMALLADRLMADRALEWGLVNQVVDHTQLMGEALGLARRLVEGPAALPLTRRLFWDERGYEAQLAREAAAQEQAGATDDFLEGLAAFEEKREPKFSGS
jgi:2-(1,2-epoxy-1,2-dihydrophenyl)acetyl-CoA isomerase